MLFNIERPEQVIAAISENESKELYEQAAANTPGFRVTFHKDVDPIQPRFRLWKKQRDMARITIESGEPPFDFTPFWDQLQILATNEQV